MFQSNFQDKNNAKIINGRHTAKFFFKSFENTFLVPMLN